MPLQYTVVANFSTKIVRIVDWSMVFSNIKILGAAVFDSQLTSFFYRIYRFSLLEFWTKQKIILHTDMGIPIRTLKVL